MLNLLTTEERRIIRREYILRLCTVATIFAFFTFVMALASILPAYFYATTEERSKRVNLAALVFESERAGDDSVALELSRASTILSLLGTDGEEKPKASEIVREALIARPNGARVDTLSFDMVDGERVLTIAGIADTRATLIEYSRALTAAPTFLSADVPAVDLAKTRSINFHLTVRGNF